MTERTIRCANAGIYIAAAVLIWAAAIYVALQPESGHVRQIGGVAAALVAGIWAAHYACLRFIISPAGVEHRALLRPARCIAWAELRSAELKETRLQGVAGITIILKSDTCTITLSSDTLPLEAMEDLVTELREQKHLS